MAKFLDTEQVEHDLDPGVVIRHAEQIGEHNAVIEGLKTWQEKVDQTLSDLDARASSALDMAAQAPATVPEEIWNRIGSLETKLDEALREEPEPEKDDKEPEPVEKPEAKNDEPKEPSGTKKSLLHRLARAFR